MPVVAQVSDLHLSPRVPERQQQAEQVLAGVNASRPDLTVITGDLTDDGWDRPDDLVWAKQWVDERLDGEWFAVPGNHDVGNFVSLPEGRVNTRRVKAWDDCLGSFSLTDVGGWYLLALNSMLFESGIDAERAQSSWVHEQLLTIDMLYGKLMVVMHSPLFVEKPIQAISQDTDYWLGPAAPRLRLLEELKRIDTTVLIASGHVHQTRLSLDQFPKTVWAPPASGTWVHAPGLPNPPAPERTGFVLHHLGDDGSVRSEVVECAPMLKTVWYDPLGQGG